jgi:hypothetical protein
MSWQCPQIANRAPERCCIGCMNDGIGVNAMVTIEIGDSASLSKVLDAEPFGAVPIDSPKPSKRCGMAVEDGYDAAVAR